MRQTKVILAVAVLFSAAIPLVAFAAPATTATSGPRYDLLSDAPYAVFTHPTGSPAPLLGGVPGVDVAGDVDITPYAQAQNEPAIAVSPTDPNFLIAAWNDYFYVNTNNPYVWNGAGISHDGGATWSAGLMGPNPHDKAWKAEDNLFISPASPPNKPGIGAGFAQYGGDPIAAINGNGNAIAGQILFNGAETMSGVYVQPYSANGEALQAQFPQIMANGGPDTRFGLPGIEASAGKTPGFTDKPWMAADPNGPDFVIAWTNFAQGFGSSAITVVVSTDGAGQSWSAPKVVSGSASLTQGADIAFGANHEIYVSYVTLDCFSLTGCVTVKVVKSTDNGATWSAPVTVASAPGLYMPTASFRYAIFPHIAVSPTTGAVVVVWPQGSGTVLGSVSTDGGASWSSAAAILPSGSTQYMPDITVDNSGVFTVGMYNTFDAGHHLSQYSYLTSTNGVAWSAPRVVQTGVNDMYNTGWWFMGDYTTVAADKNGVVHSVWTDTSGMQSQDIHTGR
ncbi:MAG: sialidase family protein [Thermoplasmatota archaeon]